MKLRPLVLVVGAALSVTLVAGCGGNSSGGASSSAPVAAAPSKAASMVAGEAVAAIKKATSGHIAVTQTGSASSSSGASVPTTTSVEGQFDDSNYQLANSYAGGASLNVLIVDQKGYVKGNVTYWTGVGLPNDDATALSQKWAQGNSTRPEAFAEYSPSKVRDQLVSDLDATTFTSSESITVNNKAAYRLQSATGTQLVIDAETMLPSAMKSQTKTYDMSQWNSVSPKVAPPTSQVTTG
ncbi:hypothetical protein EFN04_01060 [Propionibacterium freudenreichii]|nr:hypothetical protein [Propionibacterium freudenreichii]